MNTITVMLKTKEEKFFRKTVQILLPSFEQCIKRSKNTVCLLTPHTNQFDRTLVGWKKHWKGVRCQSDGWQSLAESTSAVVSWLLLTPTRLNPTSRWDHIMYIPWTVGPQTVCLTPGLETSSAALLSIMPLTLPGVCLSACSSAALWEGAGAPSLLLTAFLQCCMSEQEPCDNNSPSEGKPQDTLSTL